MNEIINKEIIKQILEKHYAQKNFPIEQIRVSSDILHLENQTVLAKALIKQTYGPYSDTLRRFKIDYKNGLVLEEEIDSRGDLGG